MVSVVAAYLASARGAVDFSFPSADPVNDGMDWSSLKLVFQPAETRWYLVGVVHGEWTI